MGNNRKPTFQLGEKRSLSCSPIVGLAVRTECINLILHTMRGHHYLAEGTSPVAESLFRAAGFTASGFWSVGLFRTSGRIFAPRAFSPNHRLKALVVVQHRPKLLQPGLHCDSKA